MGVADYGEEGEEGFGFVVGEGGDCVCSTPIHYCCSILFFFCFVFGFFEMSDGCLLG